jgi:hypothetical protein
MQYNIYVTNKTKGVGRVYARLRGDKLQESENYSRVLNEMSVNATLEKKAGFGYSSKREDERKSRSVFACLVQGNAQSVILT